ncbi:hypothetical protein HYH03_004947 [Edaphochlamys debaryana]|uniref:MYND-type domain-containing protein n=1 Tax=Edaphochlamys debaryana TaxID=47281 RepID=A0A835Y9Y8_9CHLO|nr:hypothetical protein HYH03_004947 [Edaphochlamys debaryana]|eukprot:KAG2496941.1 hypothetical protein HYH03_004947 [Edaphochlamys debaryana]
MAAARDSAQPPSERECANCGATERLLRCSRCRAEWFCSLACHKAYYPVHRAFCRRNDFADALEEADPRFSAFLRRHGKQAVLGDAEVERLERAGRAVLGPGRQEAMQGMYGRLDPQPEPPSYSPEEQQRVMARRLEEAAKARLMSRQDKAWEEIQIEPGMGLECAGYKWRQTQSHVHVFLRLPEGLPGACLGLDLTPQRLAIAAGPGQAPLLEGRLYAEIKAELSTWFVDDGVLTLQLLKRCRRGSYAPGATNADTWWRSLWADQPQGETIQRRHPPTAYYWTEYEEDDLAPEPALAPALPPPKSRRATAPADASGGPAPEPLRAA